MNEFKLPLFIQVNDLNPEQSPKYNFSALGVLNKLLKESPLTETEMQQVVKITVEADLPAAILERLIQEGADINHTYSGVEKLLYIAWKNMAADSKQSQAVFNLLLDKGAFLDITAKEPEFYQEIDPQFAKIAPHNTTSNQLATKPKS